MSAEGALVEELKRLVLENERLRSALVLMDQEHELHPLPSEGSRLLFSPMTARVRFSTLQSPQEMRMAAFRALAAELVEKATPSSWASIDPLGDQFVLRAFIGTIK